MRNFVPVRMVRATGTMSRVNIDDGDMWLCEFDPGVMASIQSSYVTVGNYPGIEARIYGSEGALIVRLVEEFGICQTIKTATKDSVEFVERRDPGQATSRRAALAASRGRSCSTPTWCSNFANEILEAARPTRATSPRARWCSGPSTPSSAPPASGAWVGFPLDGAAARGTAASGRP